MTLSQVPRHHNLTPPRSQAVVNRRKALALLTPSVMQYMSEAIAGQDIPTQAKDSTPLSTLRSSEAKIARRRQLAQLTPSVANTFMQRQQQQQQQQPRTPPSSIFISDMSSIRDSLNLSGGTAEVLHPGDPSRPTPEVNGSAARAKTNPSTPLMFSIGSAQACSTLSVSKASTRKRHRYFTRLSVRHLN